MYDLGSIERHVLWHPSHLVWYRIRVPRHEFLILKCQTTTEYEEDYRLTGPPAYSDTVGTRQDCHCNRCHCKREALYLFTLFDRT